MQSYNIIQQNNWHVLLKEAHRKKVRRDGRITHTSIIRVVSSHSGSSLSRQFIKLTRGDALVDSSAHLLRDKHRLTVLGAEPITELLQPRGDLVEVDRLLTPISLNDIHFPRYKRDLTPTGQIRRTGPLQRSECWSAQFEAEEIWVSI